MALAAALLCFYYCAFSSGVLLSNETDRLALLEFKSKISSDPLGILSSWNDSVHFCEWYGVSCSKRHHGRVTVLDLSSRGISGPISPHVGNLSFLKFLCLYNNSFTGEIPPEIGRLRRLEQLRLYNNSLDGKIPSNISRCSSLMVFRVEYNKLVGGLPWQFGLLSELQYFYARSNNLSGSIPPAFGNLSSLLDFDGRQNQLSGRVPDTLGQLKSLTSLHLNFNNLSGEITASIFNLTSLTDLWLGFNKLHGSLPWNLGTSLPNLENFDVARNLLTGSVPPSLSNASNFVLLQLTSNNFTGSMPSMAGSNKLQHFRIANNSLGSGKFNDLSFLSSLTNATNLKDLEISRNNFGGRLQQHLGNLSTTLKRLSFNNNKISGNIPSDIQYLVNLEEFWAYNNYLLGTIPSSIEKLKSLEILQLRNNKLSGHIPFSMGNLTRLINLDISDNYLFGEIPASIQNCKQLLRLHIFGNHFTGVIPLEVLSLTSLSIALDLSYNQFTGAIPGEVRNLKNLEYLNLSHNMLSGNIPSSLGSCISLESIYLQGNRLQGIIPSSLSSLRGLQYLNLSSNNLSGQIPKFLESMDISGFLDLSHNNFDGEVPTQGVFKNSSIVSVIGNSKLCGGITALQLPPCSFTRHTKKTMSLKWKIVISTISSLLFLTFVGSCCFILLIKRRRRQDKSSKGDPKLLQLSYQRLFKATDGFSLANQIGVGSFGSVYKGVLDEICDASINIAVKVFNLQRRGASKSFIAECEALRNIRHKNLVKIVTVCSSIDHEGNDFKALIYEFLANGSLEDWLHRQIERIGESTTTRSLNFIQRLNVAIDIASAVDYLHNNCGTPIVHCDLKPSNVLLDEDMVAHVGDFGLARFLSTVKNPSSSTIGIKGTVGYAPPEYGMGNEVSTQGDVYSYGILLLELFTGKRPTDETFKDGLSLHNIVKSALSKQRTSEVLDPILLNELLRRLTTHHNETDRLALVKFRSMITDDPLGALSSWNNSVHFCEWYGVSCSERHHGRVTALNLSSHGLSGSISPYVGNLSFLKELFLSYNNFTGEIPPEIGRLHRLQWLSLRNNLLDGKIPSNISRCSDLTTFSVGHNKLVGGLPWQLGLLSKLQYFYAHSNNLTGSIPFAFGNLSSLIVFDGGRNQLSGRVPNTLGRLNSLTELYLNFNNLSCEIPASIFNLTSLTLLSFGFNYQLHGNLPSDLGISLPNLEYFDVAYNQFTGSIPSSISNSTNLGLLEANNNYFTGSMPSMENSNKLMWVQISNNSLGSGLANDLSFLSSFTNATSLEVDISMNNFGGRLPQHLSNFKVLGFSNNKISGNIPRGIQYLFNLKVLSASNNYLSGTIPSNIGNLKSLEILDLHKNKLSGRIPFSIGNLTKLFQLDISSNRLRGEIPVSIQNCQRVQYFNLSRNHLTGVIPQQVLSLTSLSIVLDLSENRFSGVLPMEVGNLKNLGILDISYNMLSGSIPISLGSCIKLESLYLQGNLLQGIIPSSFSSLRGIQYLDLSSNNLSGQIPKFLVSMNISSLLNLSHNNFDGEVPTQGAFKNSSVISVVGNSKLCGGVTALQLPPCTFTRHTKKTMSLKWKIVISTILSLLFLTFIGSCCFILFIKQKRRPNKSSTDDPKLLQLSYQRLFEATNGFSSANQIGVGSFGSVYKGVLNEIGEASINIAVKVFNLQRRGASKSFMAECEALKNIRHKNLVRIVTVCSSIDHEGNDFKALIYEFLANGSLEDWLHRPIERTGESTTTGSLNFIQRLNVAIDIASAVDYLHNNCGTPIVHCDLKPSNVLLDEDMVAHVSDFGLARFLSTVKNPSSNTIGIKGTVGYAPPEYGMGNEVSIQGDVYSYGILLLELFTGRRPTDETFSDGLSLNNIVKNALSKQNTSEVVDPILLNTSSSNEARKDLEKLMSSILEIGVACSSDIPQERASMSEVLSSLTAIVLLSNETDRLALLHFKSKISGNLLGTLSSWNDSVHFCEWYGVSCSKRHYGRVTALSLDSEGLSGSVSPHIGNLSFLKELVLFNNSFIGEIPSEIGRLHRLQVLGLFNNSLGGEIPSNISRCSNLTKFSVANNKLVGGLPWQFGQLNKLQLFNVRSNNLTGSVPLTFGNLSSLQVFEVGFNQLSGRVPDTLGRLQNLMQLDLTFNNLSGEIPTSIFNLSSLTDLWFGYNYKLHGSLPWNLGVTLPNLENFDVAANQFTGSVPPSLSNASNLVLLQLYSNNFTGSMPSMTNSNKLVFFFITNNSLGSGKANDLSFLSSLTNATNLEDLHIHRNNFGGSLPQHLGNLSISLKSLVINDNKISGNIPSDIQYLVNLAEFWAYNNYLSGTIPSNIGKLKSLERLHLYNNKLSGHIPSSMGNLTKLIELDISDNYFSGKIPVSIQKCQKITLLRLSHNNLSGVIPQQLWSLTSLSISLDLSGNRFTGALPVEVGNLKNLESLDISHNMLSGNIPISFGSCISLQGLNLQGNRLQGIIPSSFSSLRGIQWLDLSSNNLSGQIPKFLENMDISIFVNLSHNNFDGEVPTQGVFRNSSIVSVVGNSKLCGGVAALQLPPCTFTRHSKKKLGLKWKIVISTISSLLFLTFIGSCCFILLIKQRRRRDKSSMDDPKLLQLSYQKLFEATNGFPLANQIGVGSFGSVYKGVLNEIGEASINIAVKVFNLQRRGASKSFMTECEALKNIRHKNLVRIVTVCSSVDHEGNDFKALIYEFLANGSLEDWLHRPIERTGSLNFIQRLNVAIDIASAVDYLHNNCGTPIVHCDLKPSNVLLDEDMVAHVGDFGLARFLSAVANPSSSTIGIKGTIGYAPPEYGMGNEVSTQGDIYSYGILLLKLFTGNRPTDETFKDGLSLHNIVKIALSKQRTLTTHHNYATTSSSDEARKDLEKLMSSILEIGVACSSDIPQERASMSEVLSSLIAIKTSLVGRR
ncbi:Probable LRR receptor-like serine/threonine-protein kinase At3g47570 [Linum perenne]